MVRASICFLIKDGSVILAEKKDKVGKGKLNAYGGKLEDGETMIECAIRETEKESGVKVDPESLEQVAHMDFEIRLDSGKIEPLFSCDVFFIHKWAGDPVASDEMGMPETFPVDRLPLDRMIVGDRCWVPRIMQGKRINGRLRYSSDKESIVSFTYHDDHFS